MEPRLVLARWIRVIWATLLVVSLSMGLAVLTKVAPGVHRTAPGPAATTQAATGGNAQVKVSRAGLPLSFEPYSGVSGRPRNFVARGAGYSMLMAPNKVLLALKRSGPKQEIRNPRIAATRSEHFGLPSSILAELPHPVEQEHTANDAVLAMRVVGASPTAKATGLDEFPGKSNYFTGNDPKKWRTSVSTFAKVQYKNVYPGIDLVYYGNQNQLEYDFVIAPGSKPNQINLAFELQSQSEGKFEAPIVDGNGDLVIAVDAREVRFHKPLVYQQGSQTGTRIPVEGRYVLRAENRIGFEVGEYDRSKPLVIDPTLLYSTYLGGNGLASGGSPLLGDRGFGVTLDSSGNVYVAGITGSTNFPPAPVNGFQSASGGGTDVFVMKFDPNFNLIYSTYLGGSGTDQAEGIAVDSSGDAYVVGGTSSKNFPLVNPLPGHTTLAGTENVFVTKLDPTGKNLLFSTYYGGSGVDLAFAVAVDSTGVYVSGHTNSSNFPKTVGPTFAGSIDAFLTKFALDGSSVRYSRLLTGTGSTGTTDQTHAYSVDVDSSQNAYLAGESTSKTLPVTSNAVQMTNNITVAGNGTVFVGKVTPDGSAFVYLTYLGGSTDESAGNMKVDSFGSVYVTGGTASTDFPVTPGVVQSQNHSISGDYDVFVTKLDPTGSTLTYSTLFGGSNDDFGDGIAVDSLGNAHVGGYSQSTDLPTTANAFQPKSGGSWDAFVFEINPTATAVVYASYLGGSGLDTCNAFAIDPAGNVYMSGHESSGSTGTTGFPTKGNPFQSTYGGGVSNAYLAKVSPGTFTLTVTPSGAGSGTVTSTPAGINCGSTCSFDFLSAQPVTLMASAATGSAFSAWSGACSGTGNCNVTMNAAAAVTANFVAATFTLAPAQSSLTISPGGQGTVAIAVNSTGTLANPVQLTCTVAGPSPMPTCALNPNSVSPGPNVTSTLTISVPSTAALEPLPLRPARLLYAMWLPLGIFGMGLAGGPGKRRVRHWIGYALLLLLLGFVAACGSNRRAIGVTNYTVTVTGSSGSLQQSSKVTVTVP